MVVRKTSLMKDAFRDIKNSIGRFIAIVSIVALGVAFFSGLKIAPEDMKYTADKYYDDYKLMDIHVMSTLGLTEEDLESIDKIEGIEESRGTYTLDALTNYKDRELVLKVHGFLSEDQINGVRLIEGRLPEKDNEAVVEAGKEKAKNIAIGEKLVLENNKDDLEEDLKNTEFKVVGRVQTPYYLSFEKGNSNLASGKVDSFIMIPEENFKLDIYTDIYTSVEGARKVNSYKDEYFDIVDKVRDRLKELAKDREDIRYDELITEAREDLDEAREEYKKEKEKVEGELDKVLSELEEGKREIEKGEILLYNQERDFETRIENGKEEIRNAEKEIEEGEEEYQSGLEKFEREISQAEKEIEKKEKKIEKMEREIPKLEEEIEKGEKALKDPSIPDEMKKEIEEGIKEAKLGIRQIEGAREELELGKKDLENEKKAGKKELKETNQRLISAKSELEKEKSNLEKSEREAREEIEKARADLEQAKVDLEEGEEEYQENKIKVEEELDKALEKIEDGEDKIEDIEEAEWYVLDRESHYSYVDYGGAADRIDALSKVFPLFFAMVAALVSLTTMTRMVDEQRVNIGTLKALGYNRGDIAFKYIIYALTATIIGSILGIAIGYTVFPIVIFNAYGMMYLLPPVVLRFNPLLALGITLVSVGLTTGTAYLACNNELKETAASLMLPKAPKIGKRILLEKIPIIWDRFNFSYKVTMRNIFRYKRRFLMTVFGIAGCTALVLAAFGLRDSIKGIIDNQYETLFNYDISIGLEERGIDKLEEIEDLESYQLLQREGGSISLNQTEKDISIVTPENVNDFSRFVRLQNPKDKRRISIEEKGVVITEQVSKSLKVRVGDEILLRNSEDEEKLVRISGITENYTSNYLYISPKYYREIFEKKLENNEALGILASDLQSSENNISKELLDKRGITSVELTKTLREELQDIIDSLGYVVLVMIVSAGSLAFVVLYNLTNVNISERIREIATIKVLGFYDNEVSAYIYRENVILTIIGIIAGLGMGILLHRYIMTTVEMDNIMFGLRLKGLSYLYSIVLTLGFSIIVNYVMHHKLKDIEMVESLKSID